MQNDEEKHKTQERVDHLGKDGRGVGVAEDTHGINLAILFYERISICGMKNLLIIVLFLVSSCAVLQNNTVVYKQAKSLPDTAFVYSLPYAIGTSHPVWQGYWSLFSHWGNFAIDFRMKKGTAVHAARAGVVVFVRQDRQKGGVGRRFIVQENSIVIRHSDSSFGHYLHLQYKGSLVSVGDTVQQGQQIGWSGSTGFSAFPHLHFEVTKGLEKARSEIPVRFKTENGAVFLQPLRRYKAI